MEGRIERSRLAYERAAFGDDPSGLAAADRDLDALEADLALARGRLLHARFLADAKTDPRELALFQRAAQLYQQVGDLRGEGEALLWVGVFHQVVRRDNEAAVQVLDHSYKLATRVNDTLTASYVLRHLGIADHAAGRLEAARERLAESLRLRRDLGFLPGVAANLVGLAYIAAAQGRHDDALALIAEAGSVAEAAGAHAIVRQVEEATKHILAAAETPTE